MKSRAWLAGVVAVVWLASARPAPLRAQAAAGPQTLEGTLSIMWGDPRYAGTRGAVRYTLETPDGRYVRVEPQGNAGELVRLQGRRVVVSGRMTSTASAIGGAGTDAIVAETIGAAAGEPDAAVSGTKRVIYVLLRFSDDAGTPHTPSFFLNLTNPDPSVDPAIPTTINAFFRKVSNDTFAWSADVAGGAWLTLPQPKSYYAPCDFAIACFDELKFNPHAIAAAKGAGVDFTAYDNVSFVVNNDLDCCAWGGQVSIDGRTLGATWTPPWAQNTSTFVHEMGHSLGLPHSGWLYYAYDSPWDTMSAILTAKATLCGSYLSRNDGGVATALICDEPGNGFIAAHRDHLGWMPPANQISVNANHPGFTAAIEANSLPAGSGVKLLKICLPGYACTGSGATTRYFTVEARVKSAGAASQYDNAIPDEGVIIHDVYFGRPAISGSCFFSDESGWAVPVDATPGDFNPATCVQAAGGGLYNAQFDPGQTYTNTQFGFKVTVVDRQVNTYTVVVQTTYSTQMSVDTPANGSTASLPFTVQGWAVNRAAWGGTGVDMVHVYATPAGGTAAFVGQATYGAARSDIGAIFGPEFTNSGFALTVTTLPAGSYMLTVYARNAATAAFDSAVSANVTVAGPVTNPFIATDTPGHGVTVTSAFEVGGWTIDQGAPAGTGVDAVQVYVVPSGGSLPGIFIGNASYGWSRPDVAAIFGSRFQNSGFHFTITGLGPGTYTLAVYARSTVTGSFSILRTSTFTVSATSLMSIDVPGAESTISGATFAVDGWSIDRNVESTAIAGPGVDALHVYAYPNPATGGGAPVFLGVATVGVARPDLAAIF